MTLRVILSHIFRLSSAPFRSNHPVNFYRGLHFWWLSYFSTEFVEDVSNSWSRRWWLGNGFEWWKRGWGLDWARSRLGGDPSLPGHSHGPSSAQVWTENSIHRGVFFVDYQKSWTCSGTWKKKLLSNIDEEKLQRFMVIVSEYTASWVLFSAVQSWACRIYKSLAFMFESQLLIQDWKQTILCMEKSIEGILPPSFAWV